MAAAFVEFVRHGFHSQRSIGRHSLSYGPATNLAIPSGSSNAALRSHGARGRTPSYNLWSIHAPRRVTPARCERHPRCEASANNRGKLLRNVADSLGIE